MFVIVLVATRFSTTPGLDQSIRLLNFLVFFLESH